MRKRDKLKNIEQANLMLEQCYLKSKGLLKEDTTSDIFKDISTDDLVVSYCFDREKYKIPYIQLVKEELLNRNYDLSTIPDLTPKQEDIPVSNGRSIRYIVISSIISLIVL